MAHPHPPFFCVKRNEAKRVKKALLAGWEWRSPEARIEQSDKVDIMQFYFHEKQFNNNEITLSFSVLKIDTAHSPHITGN